MDFYSNRAATLKALRPCERLCGAQFGNAPPGQSQEGDDEQKLFLSNIAVKLAGTHMNQQDFYFKQVGRHFNQGLQ